MPTATWKFRLAWLASLLLAGAVLAPGLAGGFLFDDFANIVDNRALHIEHLDWPALANALTGPSAGPLGRPVSVLSFALTHAFFGLDPYAFKAVNLALHLINGLLAGWLLNVVLAALPGAPAPWRRWLPLWVAALWLVHPINVVPVILAVQRMTLLSGLFTLLALVGHAKALTAAPGRRLAWLAGSWLLFWPLAVLSKETGLLFPLYALLVTLLLRPQHWLPLAAGAAALGISAATAIWYSLGWNWLAAGYAMRAFTLPERLLTEARVLWFYLGQILLPAPDAFGLYLDDIPLSSGWFDPPATALALAGWLVVSALIVALWRRQVLVGFGLAWFLVGHALESTFLPLEIAHEYRNYLPALGPILVAGFLAAAALSRLPRPPGRVVVTALALGPVAMLAAFTWLRASQWGDPLRGTWLETINHPHSARANYTLAVGLVQAGYGDAGDPLGAHWVRYHFLASTEADASFKQGHVGLITWACASARPPEREWVEELARRLEMLPYAPKDLELPKDLLRPMIAMPRCLGREDALRLLEAGSRNVRIVPSLRARFLESAADYELLVSLDPVSAAAYMARAIELDPGNALLRQKLGAAG